ncbi:MAG: MaoC family dehydratase [Alphaproteobacteria bacterium]|nr:MAG: MaoC family dehydratase [Alphaproteobacteria bacterium]
MVPNRPEIRRYFEDLQVGEKSVSSPLTVTEAEMLEFARKYDPQWFHADPEAARESNFRGLIASGIYTAALWRQMDHEINGDVAFICGFGWDEVRWPVPVRPGDVLRATSEVLDKRPSESKPDRGHATFLYQVLNQNDEVVLSFRSLNLVSRRPETVIAD